MRTLPAIRGVPQGQTTTLTLTTGFPAAISDFEAQQQAAAALETLLIADVLLAGLFVVITCARLAASAYRPELALLRARGGSARLVASRVLTRSACLAGPGAVAGAAAAVAITPAPTNGSAAAWLLGGLAAAAVTGIPALAAGWAHRSIRPAADGRAELVTTRPSRRRLVAELTLLVLAGATLAAGRLRGIGSGTDALSQAAPVLAAAAGALIAVRLYPVPVRGLLQLAARRPGPVGFLALARAARAPDRRAAARAHAGDQPDPGRVRRHGHRLGDGQPGRGGVAAGGRGRGRAGPAEHGGAGGTGPGHRRRARVRHVTVVSAVPGHGQAGATLQAGGGAARPVGLVVVSAASYAALTRDTPWPGFRARALGRGGAAGTPGTAVPVLASAGLGAIGGHGTLQAGGSRLPVRIAGRTGPTPAMTAGTFLALPAWAATRLPTLPGPNLLLATGTGI